MFSKFTRNAFSMVLLSSSKRKTNQLQPFKKKSLLVHKETKIKKKECSTNVFIYIHE